MPFLTTQHLILRFPTAKDVPLLHQFALENQEYLAPFEPLQLPEYFTKSYWEKSVFQAQQEFDTDQSCRFLMLLRETDTLIGMINFSNIIRGPFQSCFLGFKIGESYQRQGLMTEGLECAIDYMFKERALHRISANYMPSNLASQRVLEKNGFHKEGIAPAYLQIAGKWETHVLTARINDIDDFTPNA